MTEVIDQVMQGAVPENEIAVLLTALRAKGETADEIAGAAPAMRRHMTPIRTARTGLVDTCGTGGIGSDLFNISTAAAIVAAAAGVPVAKHGNRSITSKSGSADVLAALGVNVDAAGAGRRAVPGRAGHLLLLCPAAAPGDEARRPGAQEARLRRRSSTCSGRSAIRPARRCSCWASASASCTQTMADVLARLGTEHAVVVHGTDGLGEVSLAAPTEVIEVRGDAAARFTWQPEDFGLTSAGTRIAAGQPAPADSAALIRRVLAGEPGPPRDIVVLNAAAALWTAGDRSHRRAAAPSRAAAAIDSGAARAC